uniref:Centromeric histone Cid n=1 Tax=Drosophila malerkotliana TaxID=30036 RepID=Q8T9Y7_9MUSC|nr:centromeric histone Cid [Drosophila malerkotliana]
MRPPPKRGGGQRSTAKQPSREDTASQNSDDESAFRSPEPEDATDYGLEFTTSRLNLQDVSNRRCSTLRKNTSASRGRVGANQSTSEEEEDENEENLSPSTRSRTAQGRMAAESSQESSAAQSPRRRPGPQSPQRRPAAQSPQRRSAAQSPQRRAAAQSPQRRPAAQSPQRRPAAQPPQRNAQTSGATRRKRTTPLSRAVRMEREINKLQQFTGNLIPKLPFSRLVRELLYSQGSQMFKTTRGALEALQSSSEIYLTQRLQDAYYLTLHRGRVTLDVRDMVLMGYICENLRRN